MTSLLDVSQAYQEAIRTLSRYHRQEAPLDLHIYAFADPGKSIVRLVEVSADFPDEYGDEAWAVGFAKSNEFDWRSAVILLSPADWERVLKGEMCLPTGWDLKSCEEVTTDAEQG